MKTATKSASEQRQARMTNVYLGERGGVGGRRSKEVRGGEPLSLYKEA
eukprot:CAMPEP_0119472104 /NCGR_PEP_ID=MMETSP1344-20130328/4304_1 /TAXON_ID=236787 /ORGANISM="Florenciella parvula, Strain CCMP2471" /LENGTH=47 /DNA_ID= /DNA_START= /DNA_END= /DNA_ORIENTATION=